MRDTCHSEDRSDEESPEKIGVKLFLKSPYFTGKVTVNVLPPPTVLCTVTVPS